MLCHRWASISVPSDCSGELSFNAVLASISPGSHWRWTWAALKKFFGWQPPWSAVTAGCLHTWMPQSVRFKARGNNSALLLTCSARSTIGPGAFVYLNKLKINKQIRKSNNAWNLELQHSRAVISHLSYWKLNYISRKWHIAAITTVLCCNDVQSFPGVHRTDAEANISCHVWMLQTHFYTRILSCLLNKNARIFLSSLKRKYI